MWTLGNRTRNPSLQFTSSSASLPNSSPLPNAPAAAAAPARYPDTVAVTYDPASRWLSCVYADHSVYVWDVRDVRRAATVHRALYHAAGVWDLQVRPGTQPPPLPHCTWQSE